MGMLRITAAKGFHVTFDNGIRASIQWGPGNYCDNYDSGLPYDHKPPRGWESSTAEVAAMDDKQSGKWVTTDILKDDYGDDVRPRFTVDQVLDFLIKCRDYKREGL